MKVIPAAEASALSASLPDVAASLRPHWLEGPFTASRLDVGIVTMSPGGATPPHSHDGGQVLVVTAGRGFVDVGGERHVLEPGDIVIAEPGEVHVHGALPDGPFAHLTVTTLGYAFPAAPSS